jgi:hypothetical protein
VCSIEPVYSPYASFNTFANAGARRAPLSTLVVLALVASRTDEFQVMLRVA